MTESDMRVGIMLYLTNEQRDNLVREATLQGYKRVDPTKRWSDREYKDAIRYSVHRTLKLDSPS